MVDKNELVALAWAAGRAGVSYGKFTAGLSGRQIRDICRKYEDWKEERRREAAKAAGLGRDNA